MNRHNHAAVQQFLRHTQAKGGVITRKGDGQHSIDPANYPSLASSDAVPYLPTAMPNCILSVPVTPTLWVFSILCHSMVMRC